MAHATLDYDNVDIIFPVDEFRLTQAEVDITLRARSIIVNQCLASIGEPQYSPAPVTNENRRYGMWNVERAAKWGFGFLDGGESDETVGPEPKVESMKRCEQDHDVELRRVTPPAFLTTSSVAGRIVGTAYGLAKADPLWTSIRTEYEGCLREAGLELAQTDGGLTSRQSVDLVARGGDAAQKGPEAIRLAVIEATCNRDLNITQRLGDLEAQYQAPLIAKDIAALNEEKAANQAVLRAARAVVRG